MSRDLDSAQATAVSAASVRPITFVKLELDSGTLYLHDGVGTYTWGGNDWLGVGSFGGVDGWEEGSELSPYQLDLRLSLLDSTLATEALGSEMANRTVSLYVGAVDSDLDLVADPFLQTTGLTDVPSIVAGTENEINLSVETYAARRSQPRMALYSHATQTAEYAGDTACAFLEALQERVIPWGGRSIQFRRPDPILQASQIAVSGIISF